jgi:uncharacterized DUF497 family protein
MDNSKANTNQIKRAQHLADAQANVQDAISALQRAQDMDKGRAQHVSTFNALEVVFTTLSRITVAMEVPAGRK